MRDAIRYLGENSPVPLHCIPNAGIPHQGPEGETIFPAEPGPLAAGEPGGGAEAMHPLQSWAPTVGACDALP